MRKMILTTILLGLAMQAMAGPTEVDTQKLPGDFTVAKQAVSYLAKTNVHSDRQQLESLRLFCLTCKDTAQKKQIAGKLEAIVTNSNASVFARRYAAKQLGLLGQSSSVTPLSRLLADKSLDMWTRGALVRIATPQAADALRNAATQAKGDSLAGLIRSLGQLQDAKSVELIRSKLTADGDAVVISASLCALGRIATDDAAKALLAAKVSSKLAPFRITAMMACGQGLSAKHPVLAKSVYDAVVQSSTTKYIKEKAQLASFALMAPEKQKALIQDVIAQKDANRIGFVLKVVQVSPQPTLLLELSKQMAGLSAETQLKVLTVLESTQSDSAVAREVAKLLESENQQIRIAAVRALGVVGSSSNVSALVGVAKKDSSAEHVVTKALTVLPGKKTSEALRSAMKQQAGVPQVCLINAVVARGQHSAADDLVVILAADDRVAGSAAAKGLAAIGSGKQLAAIVELLAKGKRLSASKSKVFQACATIARRGNIDVAAKVKSKWDSAGERSRLSLLNVLAAEGSDASMHYLASHLNSDSESIRDMTRRLLASWRSAAVLPILDKALASESSSRAKYLILDGMADILKQRATVKQKAAYAGKLMLSLATLLKDKKLKTVVGNRLLGVIELFGPLASLQARQAADALIKARPDLKENQVLKKIRSRRK